MAPSFSLIREINTERTGWAMRVRLVRMYRQPIFGNPEEIGNFEMVFHDEKGERIHASMKFNIMDNLQTELVEGSLYAIKNFIVAENRSTYKTTTNRYKIFFYKSTHVTDYEDVHFPRKMFDFKKFSEFAIDREIDRYQLIDVIGRVVSFQPPFNGIGGSRRMDFIIEDLEHRQLSCTLWAEYVETLLQFLERRNNETVIVCLQFAKTVIFRGEIKISNTYHVTKVTVNGDNDDFTDIYISFHSWSIFKASGI